MKKAGWALAALVIANEIRGLIMVAAIGWPMLKAFYV
jgi:hypothetical protein